MNKVIQADALSLSGDVLLCRKGGAIHDGLVNSISHSEPIVPQTPHRGSLKGLCQPYVRAHIHCLNHPNYKTLITLSYNQGRFNLQREMNTPGGHASNTVLALTQAVCSSIQLEDSQSFVLTPLSWRNKSVMDAILTTAAYRIRIHQEVNYRIVPEITISTLGSIKNLEYYIDRVPPPIPFWY